MHSVQSVSKQTKLSRRQRRRHLYTAASSAAATAAYAATSSTTTSASSLPRYSGYKIAKTYRNTVPIVHGIVVSNLSLVLLQKEYIEQFYFEKRNGGGGPDPDADADINRHLKQPHHHRHLHYLLPTKVCPTNIYKTACTGRQLLRFG